LQGLPTKTEQQKLQSERLYHEASLMAANVPGIYVVPGFEKQMSNNKMKFNSDKMTNTAPQRALPKCHVRCSTVHGLFCRSIELLKKSFKKRGRLNLSLTETW
jgi:hypothetical protein